MAATTFYRGAGFLAFSANDINQTYTQTGINDYANIAHGNWVTFNPEWRYNTNLNPGVLRSTTDANGNAIGSWIPDSEFTTAVGWAKQAGLKVMLKPMIDPLNSDSSGTFRARCDPAAGGQSAIDAFFNSYKSMIVNYAKLAQMYNVDMLSIGCELNDLVDKYPSKWSDIITSIRAVYSGILTYASGSLTHPKTFWDQLDVLGYDFYPQLQHTTSSWSTGSAITSGSSVSAVTVSGGLKYALAAGTFTINDSGHSQTFTTTGAAVGATSVPVTTATANNNYPQYAYCIGTAASATQPYTDVAAMRKALTTATDDSGSTSYVAQLAKFSSDNGNKGVIITETGFEARVGGSGQNSQSTTQSQEEQAAAVQALVSELESGAYPWYKGLFFWGWFCHNDQVNQNIHFNQYNLKAQATLAQLWKLVGPAPTDYVPNSSGANSNVATYPYTPVTFDPYPIYVTDAELATALSNYSGGTAGSGVSPSTTIGLVNHANNNNVTRPSGFGRIDWTGTVLPNNATTGDRWTDVSNANAPTTKICISAGNFYIPASNAVSSVSGKTGAVVLSATDVSGVVRSVNTNTPDGNGNVTVAFTAPVSSVAGKTGAVTLSTSDVSGSVKSVNNATPDSNGNITISTGSTVSDATTSAKGIIQLSGDLAGTAASPTVPGLANKVTAAQAAAAAPVQSVANKTGNVTLSATDISGSVRSVNGTAPDANGNVAVSGSGTVSDATTSAKGVVQLAGDLAGTAAAPTVPALVNKITVLAWNGSAYPTRPSASVLPAGNALYIGPANQTPPDWLAASSATGAGDRWDSY